MNIRLLFRDLARLNGPGLVYRARKVERLLLQPICQWCDGFVRSRRGWRTVPVIINNRDRLDCLLQLLAWLENAGLTNIIILDNASTYPPLLAFYAQTRHKVVRLRDNGGPYALWKTPLFRRLRYRHYVYTDPDVVPVKECPHDVLAHLAGVLGRHREADKVGLGLRIDDLPDQYRLKPYVIQWESEHWKHEVEPGVFAAPIDTTFALYRPLAEGGSWLKAYRTTGAYMARHLPWYEDSKHLSEETQYYASRVGKAACHWTANNG